MGGEGDTKNRRPLDTAFKQQKLKAWQPILTPKWVIATFAALGLLFIPIGVVVVIISDSVVEVSQRYDVICDGMDNCVVDIFVDKDMKAPVYFYYKLTNFFQNHRRYVKSRSDEQLRGIEGLKPSDLASCDPKIKADNGLDLYPCGLIANSFFNDGFNATVIEPDGVEVFLSGENWQKKGIAWKTDVEDKFKYREYPGVTRETIRGTEKITLPDVTDEEFMVWMRTAGLPTFMKLNRIISSYDIKAGSRVTVSVVNKFPVKSFTGEKAVVFSTTSVLGGKNPFLGYAYITVGSICLILAVCFLIKHLTSPRTLGDMTYFSWNQEKLRGIPAPRKNAGNKGDAPAIGESPTAGVPAATTEQADAGN